MYKCLLLLQQMTDRRLQPHSAPGSQFAASWTQRQVAMVEEADTSPGAGTVSGHHTAPRQHEEETLMTLWNNHMQGTSGPGVLHMDHIMTAFLLNHAETIVAKNLMRNFVSHATTFQQAELGAEVRRDGAGGGLLHRVV